MSNYVNFDEPKKENFIKIQKIRSCKDYIRMDMIGYIASEDKNFNALINKNGSIIFSDSKQKRKIYHMKSVKPNDLEKQIISLISDPNEKREKEMKVIDKHVVSFFISALKVAGYNDLEIVPFFTEENGLNNHIHKIVHYISSKE